MTSVARKRLTSLGIFFILATASIYLLRHQLPVVMLQFLFLSAVLFLGLAAAELYFRNFNPNLAKSRGATWEGSFIPSRRGHALVAGELTRWLSQLHKRPRVAHDG
jgi:hypothetical protein